MSKMTFPSLFRGIKTKGQFVFCHPITNNAAGWEFYLRANDFEAHYEYKGDNDRTFVQRALQACKVTEEIDADLLNETINRLSEKPTHVASALDFLRAWVYVEPAQSTDETRYNLNGICVDEGKLVATDGHRMNIYPNAFPTEINGESVGQMILPSAGHTAFVRALVYNLDRGVATYTVSRTTHGLLLRTESAGFKATFSVRLCDGQFPDYKQVIPTYDLNESICITGNVGLLAAALKTAPVTLLSNKDKRLLLAIDSDGHVWACENDGTPDVRPLPVHATGWTNEERKMMVALSLTYLMEAFDGDSAFTMRLADLSPIRWEQGEALGIIMPMRA